MYDQRRETARVRHEAFSWYRGAPPSQDDARRHFAEKAKRDPQNLAVYEAALRLFLSTCWKVFPTD
jgi:hypothetical protein